MRLREAKPSDSEAVRNVHYESIKELGPQAYTPEQVDAWAQGCESADYTSAIEAEELEFIVSEADDTIVAFGSLKLAAPNHYEATVDAEVTGIYVHPSVAREGVGTRIYEELEASARTRQFHVLGLSASLNAVPFYEAHGYEQVREYMHEFSSHEATGMTGVVVEMKKEL